MKLLVILVLTMATASARSPWSKTKTLAAVACAASAVDGWTTSAAVGNPALYEANPLFRGRNGGPSMVKISVFKAAGCAAGLWIAGKTGAKGSKIADTMFVGGSVWFGAVAANNARLVRKNQ
jgi:hypothetical protein